MRQFYITTTLPYVNADPHIGFALEIIQADAVARYQRLLGKEVVFNTGTDEHGLKIYRKALETKEDPLDYCNRYAARFDALKQALNLSYTNFIRTTNIPHMSAAQEFWRLCIKSGDIYKKNYKVKYCVGCELEKTASDLVNDKCPEHPSLTLEIREEENYFFKFSAFQNKLLEFYRKNRNFVVPYSRQHEIVNFVSLGLQDFSISRLKSKMPWGIPVPDDEGQVMYVWFDALVNYISALGWPDDQERFQSFWGTKEQPNAIQIAGKDNLRQQAAMWQAMLMSVDLPNSKQIFTHGFINGEGGIKMSKTLGNVVDPIELVDKYGIDVVRYYLLRVIHPYEDSDFTPQKFEQNYTADLVNGLGNLVSRVATLIDKNNLSLNLKFTRNSEDWDEKYMELYTGVSIKMNAYKFNEVLEFLWSKLRACDEIITRTAPWKIKDLAELKNILEPVAQDILNVADLLRSFMPATAEKIIAQFTAPQIKKGEPLFPRLS